MSLECLPNAVRKMRIPGQNIITGLLVLITAGSWGAPQDHWYAERDRDFGFIGGMKYPLDILHGSNGKVYVIENDKDRAQFMNAQGEVFATRSAGDNPYAGAYGNGKLFVISVNSDRVTVFDENGTSLYSFGSRGSGNGQFESALGIATAHYGNEMEIYVSDVYDRVQVFGERGISKENFPWLMEIRVELQLMIMGRSMLLTRLIV